MSPTLRLRSQRRTLTTLPTATLIRLSPPYLFNDNTGTTQTVNNPVTNINTKRFATKEFRAQYYIAQCLLGVCYIPTDMNIADFSTKALTEPPFFCKFRAFLGIHVRVKLSCAAGTSRSMRRHGGSKPTTSKPILIPRWWLVPIELVLWQGVLGSERSKFGV